MTKILEGKTLAADLRAGVAAGVQEMIQAGMRPPGLAAVLVGDNPASHVYVVSKVRACGARRNGGRPRNRWP